MDIISSMNSVNKIGKYLVLAVLLVNLMSVGFAPEGSNLTNAITKLCTLSQQFLGAAIMVLIVLAGTVYAIGQVLGAETRARATVWATAMLTGALIGAVIYIITPIIVGQLFTGDTGITITGTNPCTTGGMDGGDTPAEGG